MPYLQRDGLRVCGRTLLVVGYGERDSLLNSQVAYPETTRPPARVCLHVGEHES